MLEARARSARSVPTSWALTILEEAFSKDLSKGRTQSAAVGIVDDLRVDMLVGVMDSEARTLCRADDFATDAVVNAPTDVLAIDSAHIAVMGMGMIAAYLLADAFAFLAADVLTDVADALALVRFWRIVGSHFGGELPNKLFVDSFHLDFGVIRHRDG